MLIRIDPASSAALHNQIAAALRGAISSGEVTSGERLPSARDLARDLDVNMHTVLRGYQALRDEGLVEMRRGRGVTVTATAGRVELVQAARSLIARAKHQGMSRDEADALLDEHWAAVGPDAVAKEETP